MQELCLPIFVPGIQYNSTCSPAQKPLSHFDSFQAGGDIIPLGGYVLYCPYLMTANPNLVIIVPEANDDILSAKEWLWWNKYCAVPPTGLFFSFSIQSSTVRRCTTPVHQPSSCAEGPGV